MKHLNTVLLVGLAVGLTLFWRKSMAETNDVKNRINNLQNKALDELSRLESEVRENQVEVDSIIAILEGVKQQLDIAVNSGNITERIIALSQALDDQQTKMRLAQAAIANTPSEPEEPPVDNEENSRTAIDDATPAPSTTDVPPFNGEPTPENR